MEMTTLIAAIVFSVFCAGIAGWAAVRFAQKTARSYSNFAEENKDSIVKSAERQRAIILEEAERAARSQFEAESARQDEERQVLLRFQNDFEVELNERQSELDKRANDLTEFDTGLDEKALVIQEVQGRSVEVGVARGQVQSDYERHLEAKANVRRQEVEAHCREEILSAEKLGITRWLMDQGEALKAESKTYAKDVLGVVYARYSPTFVWPKSSFSVESPSLAVAQRHFGEGSEILKLLMEGTDTTVDVLLDGELAPTLKISGGAGVDKEVIRLVLEEITTRNTYAPDKARLLLAKYRKQVDRFILKLGEEAIKILEVPPMHPEILKLIGSLNYRTSHRQNQYFHSIEVARLAGMIADEVGVDRVLAKRSGILHDIGKALDYKIEGSHAVISGDYATRYGEAEEVVDTVLSHHDDKVVETPHAYILKAADAMSGARPGARVDMEEGYHKRLEGIAEVVNSFQSLGVTGSAIMHAGREVHVFVDNRRIKERDIQPLAADICKKLETDVQFPGQIRVTVVRRLEVTEVA